MKKHACTDTEINTASSILKVALDCSILAPEKASDGYIACTLIAVSKQLEALLPSAKKLDDSELNSNLTSAIKLIDDASDKAIEEQLKWGKGSESSLMLELAYYKLDKASELAEMNQRLFDK